MAYAMVLVIIFIYVMKHVCSDCNYRMPQKNKAIGHCRLKKRQYTLCHTVL